MKIKFQWASQYKKQDQIPGKNKDNSKEIGSQFKIEVEVFVKYKNQETKEPIPAH